MKLPIKKKYFDLIKSGAKDIEFRDAHITFVCEETGETLTKEVMAVAHMDRRATYDLVRDYVPVDEFVKVFTDEYQIAFILKKDKKVTYFPAHIDDEGKTVNDITGVKSS